jgi:GNAT superfamily N-acetyltransferase
MKLSNINKPTGLSDFPTMDNIVINVRKADVKDTGQIASLIVQLYTELDLENYEEANEQEIHRVAHELLSQNRIVSFVAEDRGEIVALITLHHCAAIYAGGEFGEISELYVSGDYRSHRIGQKLLDAARDYAIQRDWKRLELGAPAGSRWDNTFSFYQNYGFVAIGPRLRLLVK